ncbi:MAG: SDR family NAD(P)-dependent oxidoreductase [Pseudomonadota bacterium]|nr:SDR family NAD(P)-dependent oxidoreductase [Pseudomonadota bacterium]
MTDSVTVVTGSRKGIGRFLGEHALAAGGIVVGCSRDESDLRHDHYEHCRVDISDESAVIQFFSNVRKKHGRVDHLINCASVAAMNHSLLTPGKSFRAIYETNVFGTFYCSREAAKLMQKRHYGRIVNFSTVAVPLKLDGEAAYVSTTAAHELLVRLQMIGHPGLILFSSGSTGKSKAAVHDFVPLLAKFAVRRASRRMLAFLLFDHIGGVNTLLYVISNAGTLITVEDRSPAAICAAIEQYSVEVLPTTPTFLHLLLLSDSHKQFDLSAARARWGAVRRRSAVVCHQGTENRVSSDRRDGGDRRSQRSGRRLDSARSLKLVTYGTEVMPENTLRRLREVMPHVELQQTYGLSELGILRSKSKSSDSPWVRIGGEGFETRVRDGLLEVRARSAMLGYLNAPSPFTEDGWFRTGDAVEVDGEYFRILGRRSEIINVGGEKVFPAEVETLLETMPGVEEAVVAAQPSAITGQVVVARVKLSAEESLSAFRTRMRQYCRDRLAPFKIPQKVILVDQPMHGDRFKKLRRERT